MDTTGFEAALVKDGYKDIETKALRSDYRAREHSHPFDVRALVLAGEITLTWNGDARKASGTRNAATSAPSTAVACAAPHAILGSVHQAQAAANSDNDHVQYSNDPGC